MKEHQIFNGLGYALVGMCESTYDKLHVTRISIDYRAPQRLTDEVEVITKGVVGVYVHGAEDLSIHRCL